MKVFKENQSLRELASVPFSLNLMINIFPQLTKPKQPVEIQQSSKKEEIQSIPNQKIMKYDVYQIFLRKFYFNEVKRVVQSTDQFNDLLQANFGLEVQEKDYNVESRLEELFDKLDQFNGLLCWQLMKIEQFVFGFEEAFRIVWKMENRKDN